MATSKRLLRYSGSTVPRCTKRSRSTRSLDSRILADMHYREFAPGEDAGRFVDRYWVLEGAAPGAVQRVVPDGRPELIVNLGQPFESLDEGEWRTQPRCFLAGQLTGPLLLRAAGATRILGVRL